MSLPTPFAPVVLYSEDAEAVHDALLASGQIELAHKIREKANRSDLDRLYAEYVTKASDDEFDHDDEPIVAQSNEGAYVMVWRWVSRATIRRAVRVRKKQQQIPV